MKLALEIRMNGKKMVHEQTMNLLETLTNSANQEGFYKSCKALEPLFANAKPETKFEIVFPYGTYVSTVKDIHAVLNDVLETRKANQVHYDAIRTADVILSTKFAFVLDGVKPENKRGKPKSELKFE